MKKIFIFLIIYLIISQISLLQFVNSTYEIKNPNPNSFSYGKKQLIISTHDYEHIDIFIILNEIIKQKYPVTIVFADHLWNYLLYYYLQFLGKFHIQFLFTTNGTVNKVSNLLQQNQTVIIYSYRSNESTGIYHILRNTKSPIVICKITSDHEYTNLDQNDCLLSIFLKNFGKHYFVEYSNFNYNYHLVSLKPKEFIKRINDELYQ